MVVSQKPTEKKISKAPTLETNRKLVLQSSDSEAAVNPPSLNKKPRKSKTKPALSPLATKVIKEVPVSQFPGATKVTESVAQVVSKDAEKHVTYKAKISEVPVSTRTIRMPTPLLGCCHQRFN